MADSVATLNTIVADPEFAKLSPEDQKHVLTRVRGVPAQSTKPLVGNLNDFPEQGSYDRKDADTMIDVSRPFVANAAGTFAGGLAAPSGPGALVARTGAYSITDALMQYLKEKKPDSVLGALGEGAAQSVSNDVLGKLFKTVIGTGKSFIKADQPEIFNFSPTSSQALKATGSPKLAAGAKLLEDLSLSAKEKALDRSAGAGFTQALKTARGMNFNFSRNPNTMLDIINNDIPVGDTLGKLDTVIRDPKKLQDVLTSAQTNGVGFNLKKSLQGYQFMKMFNDASIRSVEKGNPLTDNVVKIDSQKISNAWLDPEMRDSFEKLYSKTERNTISEFFKNVAATQDKPNTNPIAKKIMYLHGGIGIGTGLLTGSVPIGAMTSGTAFIGAEILGRLLTNPKVAGMLVKMAGGEALGYSEALAGRMLTNALQGQTIAIINADGSRTPVQVNKDKLEPIQ